MKNLRKPAPEGRPVTEGPKLVVRAPLIHSKLYGMENPGKLTSEDIPSPLDPTAVPPASSQVSESVASAKPAVRATTHDMLVPPNRDPNCASHMGCRLRRASWQPRGRRSFITNSPRASLPSPLSPPEISAAEVIARANNPAGHFACFKGCELRQVLNRLDIGMDHATMLYS
ncbi:hypothetical protein AZE42_12328 [Rhizopogon vesiculosus]|uniref:Uncharacterized protein n=1 Tax=Rhizopogon vesiculosus TaxID=180088 RepID=A0A1J8QT45_9AGAM|nr:hypothetical protein AZE42_12328 [Rhizopogon vesiculosus]